MDDTLNQVIAKFEAEIKRLNAARSIAPFRKFHLTILGQHALLIRRESLPNLRLLATTDFDALLNGEPPLEDIFKRLLKDAGLIYDNDSEYIWLPDETKYETLYQSDYIKVDSPLPIYLIVSKALKAPEKNKQLVIQAIAEFGDELLKLMEKYKVDLNYFIELEQ